MERKEAEMATSRLLDVMDKLRAECPWDREQTFDSLRNNTIEETYELADAITDKNMEGIKERKNYNIGSGDGKVPNCPSEREEAIMDAFRHFNLI